MVIEEVIDVVLAFLFIFLHESSVSFLLADLVHLHGCIIISLDSLLDHERLLLL